MKNSWFEYLLLGEVLFMIYLLINFIYLLFKSNYNLFNTCI